MSCLEVQRILGGACFDILHFDVSFETQHLLEERWYIQIGEGLAEEYFLALKIKQPTWRFRPHTCYAYC